MFGPGLEPCRNLVRGLEGAVPNRRVYILQKDVQICQVLLGLHGNHSLWQCFWLVVQKEDRFRQKSLGFLHEHNNIASLGPCQLCNYHPQCHHVQPKRRFQNFLLWCKVMLLQCKKIVLNYFRESTGWVMYLAFYRSRKFINHIQLIICAFQIQTLNGNERLV